MLYFITNTYILIQFVKLKQKFYEIILTLVNVVRSKPFHSIPSLKEKKNLSKPIRLILHPLRSSDPQFQKPRISIQSPVYSLGSQSPDQ